MRFSMPWGMNEEWGVPLRVRWSSNQPLAERGFIFKYEVDGKIYGCIPS